MNLMHQSGVYEIVCLSTGKRYIGSAKHFSKRWNVHTKCLKKQKNHSRYLQNAWNKYGKDAFKFNILLVCDPSDRLFYEQRLIDGMNPEFNICKVVGTTEGMKHTEDALVKMSVFQRARQRTRLWKGQMMCLSEVAELENIPYRSLKDRMKSGKTLEEAVGMGATKPSVKYQCEYNGRTMPVSEIAKMFNLNYKSLIRYFVRHKDINLALDVATRKKRRS